MHVAEEREAEYTNYRIGRVMPSSVPVRIVVLACACLIATVGCASFGPGANSGKQLHIGIDFPLSGAEGAVGRPALNGVRFYVQQHPTLGGFDVSVISADDAAGGKTSPDRGASNVRRFLSDSNLVAMIGPLDSAVARKEIPIANSADLAMVSPATSSTCLTRDTFLPAMLTPTRQTISCAAAGLVPASSLRPSRLINYFRLATTDDLQGPAAADYAFNTLHVLRAAVISDREAYGQGLATAFTARLQALGGTVVGHLELNSSNPDATPFLSAMKAAGVQAIYFGGSTMEQGCTIRGAMKSIFPPGEATPFLAGEGIADDPTCVKEADGNAVGIYAAVPIVDASSRPAAAATIAAFKASFGSTSDYGPYTMLSYDATAVLYAALGRAIHVSGGQLPDRGNVISQLSVTSGFDGTTGTIGFDSAGDTTNRIVSLFEPGSSDPRAAWKLVTAIDYSSKLPY